MMHTITQGDDVIRSVTCTRDGASIVIDEAATVTACLVSDDVAYGQITCLSTDSGADWPNGVVGCVWVQAISATFPLGIAKIEVQIDDGFEETWHVSRILVIEKHIT